MVLHFFETLYRLATVTCQSLAHEIRFLAVASHKNLTENFVKLSFKAVTAKSWSVLSLSLLFYPYKYLLASLQVFFSWNLGKNRGVNSLTNWQPLVNLFFQILLEISRKTNLNYWCRSSAQTSYTFWSFVIVSLHCGLTSIWENFSWKSSS